jgi:hypothetical protein
MFYYVIPVSTKRGDSSSTGGKGAYSEKAWSIVEEVSPGQLKQHPEGFPGVVRSALVTCVLLNEIRQLRQLPLSIVAVNPTQKWKPLMHSR